jgi:hypothetical protein
MGKVAKTVGCVVAACVGSFASAQEPQPAKETNQEMQARLAKVEQEMKEMRAKAEEQQKAAGEDIDSLEKRLAELQATASANSLGKRRFMMTGFAFGSFENVRHSDSTFSAGFNPIFLWTPMERLLVEAQAEFELEDVATVTKLEYVQLSYILNDYMTVGVGKFLNPANFWKERLHPNWINKLPDEPIIMDQDALIAESQVGVQLRGVVPVASSKMEYSVFVSNGGSLVTDEPGAYGTMQFDNYTDTHNAKNVGGRLGYFVLPELEFGYAIEYDANVTPSVSGVADAKSVIQSVDANFTRSLATGRLDLRSQWVFAAVDNVVFDPTGALGFGPVALDNSRNGGYLQAAYRPTNAESEFVNRLEGVVRYDRITLPTGAPEGYPEGVDESRMTFGLDYWGMANSVFKIAYQVDNKHGEPNSNAVLLQWSVGL